jgi:hypothetical protein
MAQKTPYILRVQMDKISIGIDLLENLAKEFYGQIPVAPASGNEVEIEFKDFNHPILKTPIIGKKCRAEFETALDSYLKPIS